MEFIVYFRFGVVKAERFILVFDFLILGKGIIVCLVFESGNFDFIRGW